MDRLAYNPGFILVMSAIRHNAASLYPIVDGRAHNQRPDMCGELLHFAQLYVQNSIATDIAEHLIAGADRNE